jgi:hypothetical protein
MANVYLIAFIDSLDLPRTLDTGKRYTFQEARDKADRMNQNNAAELAALEGKAFVAVNSEAQ